MKIWFAGFACATFITTCFVSGCSVIMPQPQKVFYVAFSDKDGKTATVTYLNANGEATTQNVQLPWIEEVSIESGKPLRIRVDGNDSKATYMASILVGEDRASAIPICEQYTIGGSECAAES